MDGDNRQRDDPQHREEEKDGHSDREREWARSAKAELRAAEERLWACEERESEAQAVRDQLDEDRQEAEVLFENADKALDAITAERTHA